MKFQTFKILLPRVLRNQQVQCTIQLQLLFRKAGFPMASYNVPYVIDILTSEAVGLAFARWTRNAFSSKIDASEERKGS